VLEMVGDLMEEGEDLHRFLKALDSVAWTLETPFNNWTVNQVVQHLHGTDVAAVKSIKDPEGFRQSINEQALLTSVSVATDDRPEGLELINRWWSYFAEMCDLLGKSDPSQRVPWFGPDMGVKMFATARQMETWSHAQDIYDLFQFKRTNTDRIKNIAVMGIKTFGWTYVNRQMAVPPDIPYVKLEAPSGETWDWNEPDVYNCVEGTAVDFCHVVTQGRSIDDVDLKVTGETATQWMSIAQCFAGGPKDPPAAGKRACPGYP
jgi:uncharacterized protein (TIGR03084 family)